MAPVIRTFAEDSIEKKAYRSVSDIPCEEPNDSVRLGYHVYLFLSKQYPSLKESVHVAQARMKMSEEDAVRHITERLRAEGISPD